MDIIITIYLLGILWVSHSGILLGRVIYWLICNIIYAGLIKGKR